MAQDRGNKGARPKDDLVEWFTVSYRTLYIAAAVVLIDRAITVGLLLITAAVAQLAGRAWSILRPSALGQTRSGP